MDEEQRRSPARREITYRVGWKKGKLEIGENGRVTGAESAVVFMEKALWLRVLDRYVWRRLPGLPDSCIPAALVLLPAISFGLTWGLVYLLSRP